MTAKEIRKTLRKIGNKERAEISQRFFKTGPGEYAEGDLFLGIRVPELRKLAKVCDQTGLAETIEMLRSAIHEERLLALLILIRRYAKGNDVEQMKIHKLYLQNIRYVNNWDLVDASAEHIVGAFLKDKPKDLLYKLARSKCLWERRIAIISTFHYIKRDDFSETLQIAGILLGDKEDLIHKAVGWMLREVGKRDLDSEEAFLKKHHKIMPRTMLRYAIERFPEPMRQRYLKGLV
jgi:3-methyladenine DNA glycosylase AlkD